MTPNEAHQTRIRTALTTIRRLHNDTFHPDIPKQATVGAPKAGSKPPAPIGPISARRHVRDLLTELIAMRVDETGHPGPDRGSIPERATWLDTHAGWYARHDTADSTCEELERAARMYVDVTTPPPGRWVPVGHCPEEDGGNVSVWLPADGDVDWVGECVCNVDPHHTWTRSEWSLLARLQGDEAPATLTGPELAEWLCSRLQARVTHRHVWNWVRRYPEVAAMVVDEAGVAKLDRVRFALWWLERRERTAA